MLVSSLGWWMVHGPWCYVVQKYSRSARWQCPGYSANRVKKGEARSLMHNEFITKCVHCSISGIGIVTVQSFVKQLMWLCTDFARETVPSIVSQLLFPLLFVLRSEHSHFVPWNMNMIVFTIIILLLLSLAIGITIYDSKR